MRNTHPPLPLHDLDRPADFAPDPDWFPGNLAAIAERQPALADALRGVTLPPAWRPVRALDGAPTWRIEPPGDAPRWLADTAAPRMRAEGLLAEVRTADRNPALSAIAAGGELALLLERRSPQQCVYVFVERVEALAAVLRLMPLAGAIREHWCVLIPPDDSRGAGAAAIQMLSELLNQQPGLLPPAALIALPGVDGERLSQLQRICEQVAVESAQARAARMERAHRNVVSLRTTPRVRPEAAPPSRAAEPPRLAVLALSGRGREAWLAAELADSARRLSWPVVECLGDSPLRAHPLVHAEALAAFGPGLMLTIGHEADLLPLPPSLPVARWCLEPAEALGIAPRHGRLLLAASPTIAAMVREAGNCEAETGSDRSASAVEFLWACPRSFVEAEGGYDPTGPLVLLADRPDARPEACGIEQPTHRRLWTAMCERATSGWQGPEIGNAEALLRWAERRCSVQVRDQALRAQLLKIIEFTLIPSMVAETILRRLAEAGGDVMVAGGGWQGIAAGSGVRLLAERLIEAEPSELPRPRAAVAVYPAEPLRPELLCAAGLGWPLLLFRRPGGGERAAGSGLGGVFEPKRDYAEWSDLRGLQEALRGLATDAARTGARCGRLRARIASEHTYTERLNALWERLR